ncbi:hypothetical protein P7C70_g8716, partial [Phenoliferia sp. Uapishka_3]
MIIAQGIMPEISIATSGTHDDNVITSAGLEKGACWTDTSKSADDSQITFMTTWEGAWALLGKKPKPLSIENANKASYKYGPGLISRSLDRLIDVNVVGLGVQKARVLIISPTENGNELFIRDFVKGGIKYWVSSRGYEPLVDGAEAILAKGIAKLADLTYKAPAPWTSSALVIRNAGHKWTNSRYSDKTFKAPNDARPKDLRPKQPQVSRLPPKPATSFRHEHAKGGSSTRELRREDYRRIDANTGSDSDRSRGSRGGRANANQVCMAAKRTSSTLPGRQKNKEAKIASTRSIGGPHSTLARDEYKNSYQSYQRGMATSDYPHREPMNTNYNYDGDSWRNNQGVSDAYQRGCEKAELSLESRLNPLAIPFTVSPRYSPTLSNVSLHSSFDRYSPWPAHKPLELGWSVPEPYGGYTNQQFTFVGADEISPPRALRCDA